MTRWVPLTALAIIGMLFNVGTFKRTEIPASLRAVVVSTRSRANNKTITSTASAKPSSVEDDAGLLPSPPEEEAAEGSSIVSQKEEDVTGGANEQSNLRTQEQEQQSTKEEQPQQQPAATEEPAVAVVVALPEEHDRIQKPPAPPAFYFYVYDQFRSPTNPLSPYNLTATLKSQHPKTGNCEWGLSPCVDDGTAATLYGARRNNGAADVVLADLFLRHPMGSANEHTPFATRTQDPKQADLFVVPYAHDTHCKTVGFDVRCESPAMQGLVPQILDSLEHFRDPIKKPRHLFLSSSDYPFSNRGFINRVPMRTHLGGHRKEACSVTELPADRNPTGDNSSWLCPDFVVPYLNQNPSYQPPSIQARPEDWWITRQRNVSLTAIFGALGKLGDPRCFRDHFLNQSASIFPTKTLGGLPVQLESLGKSRNIPKEQLTFELYQDSIFCLILPGDGPIQKRFFDVVMSGCIPVVFVFDRYGDNSGVLAPESKDHDPSWWDGLDGTIRKWANVRTTYPFAKGIYPDAPSLGIDYQELVVQIRPDPHNGCDFACGHNYNATCRLDCLVPHLEALLGETPPTEILRLRRNLMHAAGWFSYGLKENAFKSYDAFAVLLSQLGHVLQRMLPLQKKQ